LRDSPDGLAQNGRNKGTHCFGLMKTLWVLSIAAMIAKFFLASGSALAKDSRIAHQGNTAGKPPLTIPKSAA